MRRFIIIMLWLAPLAQADEFIPPEPADDFSQPGLAGDYTPPVLAYKMTDRPAKDLYYDCKAFVAEIERSKDQLTYSDHPANHRCYASFAAWEQAASIKAVGRSEQAIRICLSGEHEYGGTIGLIRVFIEYVEKNPNTWTKESQMTVYEALKRNFRCVYRLP